ncbi:MAG: glycosyl transferase, partial [Alphaproteobacteria bacterium]
MIPKKIHYVWFGGNTKPGHVIDTVESWRQVMPDHEILEWNEENLNISLHPWMEKMHRAGKFAFASDWARLHVLRENGGIYLDTDVELKKPLSRFEG